MGICDSICEGCFGDFFIWVCRFWGLVTAVATWGIGIETAFWGQWQGFYLLGFAVALTFFEVAFLVHYLVVLCISEGTCCRTTWNLCLRIDDWVKGIVYIGFSVPCFINPLEVWMPVIAGVMIIICGLFYMFKTFKTKVEIEKRKLAQRPSYDKFDVMQDDIEDHDDDDSVISPQGTIEIMGEETVAEQKDILEV